MEDPKWRIVFSENVGKGNNPFILTNLYIYMYIPAAILVASCIQS